MSTYSTGLPSETKVWDSSSNLTSDTKYGYDEYGVSNDPNIIGHDNANYGGGGVRGNLTSVQQLLNPGNTWITTGSFHYDTAGNRVSATAGDNNTTNFVFSDNFSDSSQNGSKYSLITQIQNALGQYSYQSMYDYSTGQSVLSADLTYQYSTHSYGSSSYSMDRLTQALHALSTPAQTTTNYVYNSPTDLTTYQDQTSSGDRAIQSEQIWDDFSRPTVSKTYTGGGSYIETDTAYDALGRIATVSNPYQPGDTPVNTTYAYDALGRTTSVTTPDSAVTNYSYAGNVTTISDPAGNSKKLVSDALGRLTDVYEDSSGSNFHTQYSTSNNVMTVNQGGQTRAFTYDSLGRLISAQNPESGTVSYNYDNAGNTISRTDARGIVTCYGSYSYPTCTKSYDQLNRPRQISYSDNTPTVTFTYDGVANGTGQLTAISNANSAMNFTAFDGMGRVSASTQQTNGVAYNFSYSYNLAGALKSEAYPSGRIVTTTSDAANRPYSLSGSLTGNGGLTNINTNYVTQTSYLANGGIGSLTRGNNLWHFESYNNRSQLTGVAEQMNNQSGAQLFNLSANWVNPAGKNNGTLQALTIASTDNPTFAQSFGYDALNRLTSASESGSWSQAYNYDQYGNMWMPTSSGLPAPSLGPVAPTTNAYSPSGPGNNRNVNSIYDNAGNLTVFGAMNVSYDAENRQTAVGSNSYSYDGFGLRVGKTTANGTTVYVYDAFGQLAAEYGSATTASLCKTCYLSGDHLGSLRLVTDQNGSAIARHDYAPFGQEIPAGIGQRSLAWGASDNVNQKFTGQIRDSETNLDFFNARYMSSGLGRFMSPDPANAGADPTDPQSWNGYGYVSGNPLNSTDPSGACAGINTGITTSPTGPGGYGLMQDAVRYGFDIGFGYAGGTHVGDIGKVAAQGLLGASLTPTNVAGAMSADVQAQSASSNSNSAIIGWSGGTAAAQNAGIPRGAAQLNFSPGGAWAPPNGPSSQTFSGSGFKDFLVNLTSPGTINRPGSPGCGHDAACMWDQHNAQINNFFQTNNVRTCPSPTVFLPPSYKVPSGGEIKPDKPPSGGGGGGSGNFPTIFFQNCGLIESEGGMVQSCKITVL